MPPPSTTIRRQRRFCSWSPAPAIAEVLASLLSNAPTQHKHVKDILRASRLPLLPADDPEVAKDLKKVAKGVALSPVLLVRGDIGTDRPMHIADGYHRVCASYHLSEDTEVPCRLVDLPLITLADVVPDGRRTQK